RRLCSGQDRAARGRTCTQSTPRRPSAPTVPTPGVLPGTGAPRDGPRPRPAPPARAIGPRHRARFVGHSPTNLAQTGPVGTGPARHAARTAHRGTRRGRPSSPAVAVVGVEAGGLPSCCGQLLDAFLPDGLRHGFGDASVE